MTLNSHTYICMHTNATCKEMWQKIDILNRIQLVCSRFCEAVYSLDEDKSGFERREEARYYASIMRDLSFSDAIRCGGKHLETD